MASEQRGLGRGLGALLGDAALELQEGGSVRIPIAQIEPGQKQPRKRFDDEALADLADSIRTHGLIQPLTVRRLSSGYYQIIAGERRWRASKLAGLTELPAMVIEADDRKVMELGLIENLQREDLNPIEEAAGYKVLMGDYGLTQEEVALRVGKSRSAVANALRLLALPDAVCLLLEEGKLSAGHARAILSVERGDQRKLLAQKILDEDFSVRQTEAYAKHLNKVAENLDSYGEPYPQPEDPNRIYRESAAKDLSDRLGRRVSIHHGAKKGKIELEYYDDDDLTSLLDVFEQLPKHAKGGKTK
ncbi:MAG: ParB/RepB/Spo0J family partition protein [Pseudoflavonifractor sp.]